MWADWLRSSTRWSRASYDGTRKSGLVFTEKPTTIRARCGFDRKRSDELETSPDFGQFEGKACDGIFADEMVMVDDSLGLAAQPINVGGAVIGA